MPELEVENASAGGEQLPQGAEGGSPEQGQPQGEQYSIESLAKMVEEMRGQVGRIPNLQKGFDTLPKTLEEMLTKKLGETQQSQYLNQLSPEAYQSYQAQQRQDQMFQQSVANIVKNQFSQMFPEIEETTNRAKQMFQGMDFMNSLRELPGMDEEKWNQLEPIYQEMLKENSKKFSDDNAWKEAQQFLDRGLKEPSWVHLQALERLQKRQAEQGGQVQASRTQAGKKFGFTPSGSAPKGSGGALPDLEDKKGWEEVSKRPGMTADKLQELVNTAKGASRR